jgi:tRNA A-37 threonylcarbamoyl transferase component Bud32
MILVGQNIGPFAIEKELGSGAMGTVYRARYTKNGRAVAIKVIAAGLGDNERVQQRFEREAEILKQLRHPNIVRLLATGKYHRSPFYAMEFIEGESLDAVLQRKGRFAWNDVITLGKQICAALQHAHDNGIIHRDLKPSNLMWDKSGQLKLTDFGIAKDTDVTGLTSANSTVGTAAYMSPEQCRGERDLTPKSDLYSLGILLYELLTGQKPFFAENAMDMFIQHVQGTFTRPAKLYPEIPIWLDTLVCQCMEKKPEQRPADAATVAKALDEVVAKVESRQSAGEEVAGRVARKTKIKADREAAQAMVSSRQRKKKKRAEEGASSRGAYVTAAALSLLLIGLVALLIYVLQPASPSELLAQGEALLAEGDRLFDAGDTNCWYKWDAAEDKYFRRIVGRYPDTKEATEARARLEYLADAKAYQKGAKYLNEVDWQKAKVQFDPMLNKLRGGVAVDSLPGKKYIAKARTELARFEAPKLYKSGDEAYRAIMKGRGAHDPANLEKWAEARRSLATLVDRYLAIDNSAAKSGKVLLDRLLLYEQVITKAKNQTTTLNPAERLVIEAVRAEMNQQEEDAAVKDRWRAVIDYGNRPVIGARPPVEDPQYRPFIQLAVERFNAISGAS